MTISSAQLRFRDCPYGLRELRELHRGSVAKETYTANLLRIGDSPIRLVYRPRSLWPLQRTETESLEYRPWLVD